MQAPRLISPKSDAPVDAQAPTFEWDGGDGSRFVIQISKDREFDEVVANVPTGSSTSISLFDLFRPDGNQYFWRVTSDTGHSSEIQSFVAAPYEVVSQAQEAEAARATKKVMAAAGVSTASTVEVLDELPFRVGTTSRTEASIVMFIMAVSFILLIGLVIGLNYF